jgi:hypothetical protein
MRYAQPRKLKTKRGALKAELNAWCLTCRQPMARHGRNFTCARCRIATRITITNGFRQRSQLVKQGQVSCANAQSSYPFCIRCQNRMHRLSRKSSGKPHAFRCRQCKAVTASQTEKTRVLKREEAILELVRAGYLDSQIVKRMRCHHTTVKRLRLQVSEVKRCECGQLQHHVNKCHLRPGWQTVAQELRSGFDDQLVRINRRVPGALPEEMRAEICQEMLLDVMRSIDEILGNVPSYMSAFQYYSFDASPDLIERIAG